MKRTTPHAEIITGTALAALLLANAVWMQSPSAAAHSNSTVAGTSDGKHHWLFAHHPRLRRITKAAGFGVVTGGLAAPLLGTSVAAGAAAGAAEHSAVRGLKDRHDMKKKGKLDSHVW